MPVRMSPILDPTEIELVHHTDSEVDYDAIAAKYPTLEQQQKFWEPILADLSRWVDIPLKNKSNAGHFNFRAISAEELRAAEDRAWAKLATGEHGNPRFRHMLEIDVFTMACMGARNVAEVGDVWGRGATKKENTILALSLLLDQNVVHDFGGWILKRCSARYSPDVEAARLGKLDLPTP